MTHDELADVQTEIVEKTTEGLAAAQARDSDDLIRLFRALDLSLEATIQGQEDDFDLSDHIDDDFKADMDDMLDYGDVHIVLTTTRDFEIDRVQDTDLDTFTSGLKFTDSEGTVVAEPGTDVDMEGVHE